MLCDKYYTFLIDKKLEVNHEDYPDIFAVRKHILKFLEKVIFPFNQRLNKKKRLGHLPSGGTIATRNKTAQASLAWLVRFSTHITRRRSHNMRSNVVLVPCRATARVALSVPR